MQPQLGAAAPGAQHGELAWAGQVPHAFQNGDRILGDQLGPAAHGRRCRVGDAQPPAVGTAVRGQDVEPAVPLDPGVHPYVVVVVQDLPAVVARVQVDDPEPVPPGGAEHAHDHQPPPVDGHGEVVEHRGGKPVAVQQYVAQVRVGTHLVPPDAPVEVVFAGRYGIGRQPPYVDQLLTAGQPG